MSSKELLLCALVGPTHSYAGLSPGNFASTRNARTRSSPRGAALQVLRMMREIHELDVPVAVMPPHERPFMPALRMQGWTGTDGDVLTQAFREAPHRVAQASSASAMWTANAATVTPSVDTADGRVHVTAANLAATVHRALEGDFTARVLGRILPGDRFVHHTPLPSAPETWDEGAANHMRLAAAHDEPGVHIYTFGRGEDEAPVDGYPRRQALGASRAIAAQHGVLPERQVFVRQHPEAIEHGAFHNDVVAVSHRDLLLLHERAWTAQPQVLGRLGDALPSLRVREVKEAELSLREAVEIYLFNSQIVDLPDGGMAVIAPIECEQHDRARAILSSLTEDGSPVRLVRYVDVRESMKNGGGPACLRLRAALSDAALSDVHPGLRFDPKRHAQLVAWVETYYRDALTPDDLGDPQLLDESRQALDALTAILGLGPLYDFQR